MILLRFFFIVNLIACSYSFSFFNQNQFNYLSDPNLNNNSQSLFSISIFNTLKYFNKTQEKIYYGANGTVFESQNSYDALRSHFFLIRTYFSDNLQSSLLLPLYHEKTAYPKSIQNTEKLGGYGIGNTELQLKYQIPLELKRHFVSTKVSFLFPSPHFNNAFYPHELIYTVDKKNIKTFGFGANTFGLDFEIAYRFLLDRQWQIITN